MSKFRTKVIKLAYERKDLRPHLLPLLKKTAKESDDNFKEWVKKKNESGGFKNPKPDAKKDKIKFDSLPKDHQKKIRKEWDKDKDKKEDGVGSKLKKGIKSIFSKAKKVTKEQKKFFRDGMHEKGSEMRRSVGKALKDKTKGIVKAIKHEVKEYKEGIKGIKKFATGKKLNEHEKEGLKTLATHAALTAATMALSGGVSGGAIALFKGFGFHLAEHSLLMSAGKAVLFASPNDSRVYVRNIFADSDDSDIEDMDDDEILEKLVKKMGDLITDAELDPEEWAEILDNVND